MKVLRIWRMVVGAVAVGALFVGSAFAQNVTGSLVGHVTDQTDAVIPNAKVEIKNLRTGQARVTSTNNAGDYTAVLLQPGAYEVTVSTPGFKTGVQTNITLEVDQIVRANFTLVVGSQTELVEVTAQALTLDTDSASVGQVVFEKQINDLPLNGRRFFDLLFVTSGAIQTGGEQSGLRIASISGDAMSIGGARSNSNGYTVDGTWIMDSGYNTPGYNPSLDAIQEFKVQTTTYSAEYGYSVNQINVVTKSGTNRLRGSVYEYLRNEKLDARDFFNIAPLPKNPLRQNQFGFSIGGPVIRDKTFFFFNYEGQRTREARTVKGNVPPPEMIQGIFPFPITDPLTGELFPQQQDGNYVIPPDRTSRYGQIVQSKPTLFWPEANATGDFNWVGGVGQEIDGDQYNFRIDHMLSSKDQVFFRGTIADNSALIPLNLSPTGDEYFRQDARNYTATWTRSFSPSLVNQFRYGYLWTKADQTSFPIPADDLAFLDLKRTFTGVGDLPLSYPSAGFGVYPGLPNVTRAYTGFGSSGLTPLGQEQFTHDIQESLSWVKGNHTIAAGFGFRWWKYPIYTSDRPLGGFGFNGQFSGHQISDFLLGYTHNVGAHIAGPASDISEGVVSRYVYSTWAPYFQDTWKVTTTLTLNIGLRYEYSPAPYEVKDAFFWFTPEIPGGGLYVADRNIAEKFGGVNPFGSGGLYGYNGMRGPGPTPKDTFAPRFGFAWRPFGGNRTVLRGGYGLYYDTQGLMEMFGSGQYWPYGESFSGIASVATGTLLNIDDLYPEVPPDAPVTPARLSFLEITGHPVRTPYMQNWSFGIQRQLTSNTTLDVAYSGNVGKALQNRTNPNQPFQCNAANNCDPLAQTPETITARKPYPNLGVMVLKAFDGYSNYHALDVKVERRTTDFTFLGVYTWSKGMDIKSAAAGVTGDAAGWSGYQDNHNARADYGLSSYDVGQRLALSFVYDVPVGRGKAALANAPKVVDTLLGGWQVNGIAIFQGGFPFTVTATDLGFINHGYGQRADLVGDPNPPGFKKTTGKWFNTEAFAQTAPGEYGNSGRNIIRGPGVNNFDLSLFKNFKLSERVRLQFRLESFNAFNHPKFGFPNANVNSPTFGVISTVSPHYRGRRNQFALRLDF